MSERRNQERRKWGRKVTYPFIDSDGVLVTKNRRRLVDRRIENHEVADKKANKTIKPTPPTLTDSSSSELSITDSQAMELEDALQNENSAITSSLNASIKNLESQILKEAEDESSVNTNTKSSAKATAKNKVPIHPLKMDSTGFQPNSSLAVDLKLKPKTDPASVSEPENETNEEISLIDEKEAGLSIELNFNGDSHVLTEKDSTFLMGRDPSCDVTIPGRYVSRSHAIIVYKNGKFFLQDDSFNGTYIRFSNGKKVHVSSQEQILTSNGVISLGEPIKKNTKTLVKFKLHM